MQLTSAEADIKTTSLGLSAFSRGGSCPRTAPSEPPHRAKSARWGPRGCSAKSACHGSRLRARRGGVPNAAAALGCRGGPVRGHPREANVIRSPHLVDVDVDLCGVSFWGGGQLLVAAFALAG